MIYRNEHESQAQTLALWLATWTSALMQEFTGREAGLFFENPVKVSEIVESRFVAGVKNVTGFAQALDGEFDASAIQIAIESFAGDLLEDIGEAARRKLTALGHVGDPQWLVGS